MTFIEPYVRGQKPLGTVMFAYAAIAVVAAAFAAVAVILGKKMKKKDDIPLGKPIDSETDFPAKNTGRSRVKFS